MITVERKVRFGRAKCGRKQLQPDAGGSEPPQGRILRVARLMALAIRCDQMIREGVVTDQAELARIGHVSRARLTQIMNLLNLAPDIQEELLYLPTPPRGRDLLSENHLRAIAGTCCWSKQRRLWNSEREVQSISRSQLGQTMS